MKLRQKFVAKKCLLQVCTSFPRQQPIRINNNTSRKTPSNCCLLTRLLKSGAILGFASLILIGASCLFILFLLLGGGIDHSPFGKFYFIQADTAGIAGAPDVSRWTLWSVCGVKNGINACPKVKAAYPFNPPANFAGPDDNIPAGFLG